MSTATLEYHPRSLNEEAKLCIPASACTYEGFCEWTLDDGFPEDGRISFLADNLLVDFSLEEIESHNKVRTAIYSALYGLVRDLDLGEFYTSGVRMQNDGPELSDEPDGMFVSWDSLEKGHVAFIPPKDRPDALLILDGSPDWVLEIVSPSSFEKDKEALRELYFEAGIPEYWLIDARGEEIDFELLVRQDSGYVAAPANKGWYFSPVFQRHFRLTRRKGRMNMWVYSLDMKE